MNKRTLYLLTNTVGLGHREATAMDLDPIHDIRTLNPMQGFGLVGGTGLGKTFAVASLVGKMVDVVVKNSSDPGSACLPYAFCVWACWPDHAEWLKRTITANPEKVQDWVERAIDATVLVLDDLGQERIKGDSDYSMGVLLEIINRRYRDGRAVVWTSNLDSKALAGIYGARTVGRLIEAWPPRVLRGKDLRVQQFTGAV